jgi:glycosyltransferase involved in cell wall biosynthesis
VDDWECLCVDGKSTDGTGEIIGNFAGEDSRFVLLESPGPSVGCARNGGIERARGRWIAFLDADDLLDSTFLRTMGQLASKFNAEIAGCCHSNFAGSREPPAAVPVEHFCTAFFPPLQALLNPEDRGFFGNGLHNCFVWGRLFERKFLQENDLSFSPIPIGEDTLFTLQAFHLAKRFALSGRVLCHHRRHRQSVMGSYRCADYREHCIAVASTARDWFRSRLASMDPRTAQLFRRRIAKIFYDGCLRGRRGRGFWASRRQSRRRLKELRRSGLFEPSTLLPRHRLRSELFLRLGL